MAETNTIRISELSTKSALDSTDEFILEDENGVNKKVTPEEIADYAQSGMQTELSSAQLDACNSGITSEKVGGLDELLSKTIAEIDDTRATTENAFSASKTLHAPTVVISANADASKTIDAYYQADGVSVKVLFLNGHSGATFTINGKTVYANKDGVAVAVPSHTINSVAWFVQAYTTLELIYLSSLDDGNGGWLVVGNPVVLSGSVVDGNNKYDYEVKVNGVILQSMIFAGSGSLITRDFLISFTNPPCVISNQHANSSDNTSYYRFGYDVTTTSITINERNASIHIIAIGD